MKSHLKIIDRILEKIAGSQSICVAGHIRPDGDCVGSELGLTLALRKQGKDVWCWNEDAMPQKYAFLDPDKLLQKPGGARAFDLVITVDCASFDRLGAAAAAVGERKFLINIDHHQSNTRYGDLNWISAREASTGELIFRLLQAANWPTTKPVTYHTAGELVRLGANVDTICHEVYQSFSLSRVRLLRHVYDHFHLTHNNQIAWLWLKIKDFARTGADRSDTEGLIDHIRAIEPVVVACVFEEVGEDLVRVSLRSKSPRINVNEILAHFGGGGHAAAAGARIAGKPLSVQRRVIGAIKKALDSAR
jgi:phosphoesterase RecJ-like protein